MRLVLFSMLLVLPTFAPAADDTATLAMGRELTKLYLAGETSIVWARMDPVMQRFLQSEESFSQFRKRSQSELGDESELLSETVQRQDGFAIYERTSRWSAAEAPRVMRWEYSSEGSIVGFGIFDKQADPEPAPTRYLDYITKATLRVPFEGEWLVFWGGRSTEQNIHLTQKQQRFALDFAIAVDGQMHQGAGLELGDYHCWGKPIYSPADGTVVSAVVDLPDQPIGTMDKRNLAGNYLIIDVGYGEYVLLSHFRQNTLMVKAGDSVRSGDELGQCGNSGNSSQPHLHFHVQNSPSFGDGDGLPAYFVNYVADGIPVSRGEPVKGQIVRNQ
jgi:murein DD-endopeptidase MepM/ murein hydrolase activator NlpD